MLFSASDSHDGLTFALISFFFLQVWSDVLADVARVNACRCNFQYDNLPPIPCRHHNARENHIYYPAANLGSMVEYWYLENENYDYHSRQCDGGTICEHYLNVSNDIDSKKLWYMGLERSIHAK